MENTDKLRRALTFFLLFMITQTQQRILFKGNTFSMIEEKKKEKNNTNKMVGISTIGL